jgi:ADP-ribosylglycohydrolase
LEHLVLLEPSAAFEHMYNGAFALESVPAAFYCFLRSADDPERVILTAVNAGYDADTVASMAGNLVVRGAGPTSCGRCDRNGGMSSNIATN